MRIALSIGFAWTSAIMHRRSLGTGTRVPVGNTGFVYNDQGSRHRLISTIPAGIKNQTAEIEFLKALA